MLYGGGGGDDDGVDDEDDVAFLDAVPFLALAAHSDDYPLLIGGGCCVV